MMTALGSVVAFVIGLFIGLVVWHRSRSRSADELNEAKLRLAGLEKEREGDAEKLDWIRKAEESMRDAFKALAGDVLKSNSETLTAQVKKDFQGVVDPLKESLTSMDGHVRELEKSREGAYKSLEQQLAQLRDTHTKLQQTTITLTEALRSPTVRGRWGEIQLRRVVEMAGMVRHVSFDEQATTDLGRPDMIAYLPNGGVLPVDSKVPLGSYLAAMDHPDDDARKQHLREHARAMRSRVKELGLKQYWDQFESSPDFVVMFVPNEACLGAAFEHDPELLEYAIDKKVLICSPVTLLALLRTVAYGWQQHQITENALRIAAEGRELYARLDTFVKHFSDLGDSVGKVVERYNRAVGSMEKRLMPSARRFKELGLSDREIETPDDIDVVPSLPEGSGRGGSNASAEEEGREGDAALRESAGTEGDALEIEREGGPAPRS
jgi:DNA recombination protein RmuC